MRVNTMFSHVRCWPPPDRRACPPRSGIILAINQEIGLVHHQLGQFTVTRSVFQNFLKELVNQASELFSGEDHIHIHVDDIVYNGARPHLNIVVRRALHIAYAAAVQSIFKSGFHFRESKSAVVIIINLL